MAILEFIGCALTAYGPSIALSSLTIVDHPVKIIIMITSAFCWLLAIICSSLVWFIIPYESFIVGPVVISVLIQEAFRFATYKLIYYTEHVMRNIIGVGGKIIPEERAVAYVSGFGFGIINGIFSFANILAELTGPGTTGLNGGSQTFSITSASVTSCFILLHTFWSIIFFQSLRSNSTIGVKYVVASHLLVSCMTLSHRQYNYFIPLTTIIIVTVFTMFYSYKIAGGQFQHLSKVFM